MIFTALTPAFFYAMNIFLTPNGYVYNGSNLDDINIFVSMNSVRNGFENPYAIGSDNTKIYENISLGSYPLFFLMGYISILTQLSASLIYTIFMVLGFLFALYSTYLLLGKINPKVQEKAFIIFMLACGVGWILYLFGTVYALGLGVLSMISVYRIILFGFFIYSILKFMEKKYILSSVTLAIGTLAYPTFLPGTFAILLSYVFVNRKIDKSMIVFIIPILALLPYVIISNGQQTIEYLTYERGLYGSGLPLITLFVSGGLVMLLTFWKLGINTYKKTFLFCIASGLFLLAQLSQSFWVSGFRFIEGFVPILIAPFIIFMIYIVNNILKTEKNSTIKFLSVSFVILLFMTVLPASLNPIIPYKLSSILWLVTVLLFSFVISGYNVKIQNLLIVIIVIASLPSIAVWFAEDHQLQNLERKELLVAYTHMDMVSLIRSLDQMPKGVVLASPEISAYLPLYTSQKIMLSIHPENVMNYSEKYSAYKEYITTGSTDVLRPYGVKYFITCIDDTGKNDYTCCDGKLSMCNSTPKIIVIN